MKELSRSLVRMLCPPNPLWSLPRLWRFCRDLTTYSRLSGHRIPYSDLWPNFDDNTGVTPVGYYFYQDTWLFHRIADSHPARHVDVGSTALLVGCLAGIVPTVSIDIRPLDVRLPGLTNMKGSIVDLPFEGDSLESLSSMCVVEHIGLGRYGDPLDPLGSVRAGRELARVLRPSGHLYVSVPLGAKSRTIFNAHRIFSLAEAVALFPGLALVECVVVGNDGVLSSLEAAKSDDFPVGLFHLTKAEKPRKTPGHRAPPM